MAGRRQHAGHLGLPRAAEQHVHAVTRRFHRAVQVLPGAHARGRHPGHVPEEQGRRLGGADGGASSDEVRRRGPVEDRGELADRLGQALLGGPEGLRQVLPAGVDDAPVPRVGDDAERRDGRRVAGRRRVAVGEVAQADDDPRGVGDGRGGLVDDRVPPARVNGFEHGQRLGAPAALRDADDRMDAGRERQRIVTGAQPPGVNAATAQHPHGRARRREARADADEDGARQQEVTGRGPRGHQARDGVHRLAQHLRLTGPGGAEGRAAAVRCPGRPLVTHGEHHAEFARWRPSPPPAR